MNCLFCDLVSKKVPAEIIAEDEDLLVFKDINPEAPLHYLIIPKQHIATINELSFENAALIGKMILKAQNVAALNNIAQDGYRLVFNVNPKGGQVIYHLHLHLLGGRQMTWPPG